MTTASNKKGIPKRFNARLEFIDELLYKNQYISKMNLFDRVKRNFDVKESSINKDIEKLKRYLETYNIKNRTQIKLTCNKNTGYSYSENGFRLFNDTVSDEEKDLLLLASSLFNIFQGTELHQQFEQIVNRLIDESVTGDKFVNKKTKDFIQIEHTLNTTGRKWIPGFLNAIEKKWTVEAIYQNNQGEQKKKVLSPYVIKQYNGKWYLVGYDHTSSRNEKTNVFLLDNFKSIDHSNKEYFSDPDFSPQDYFKYSIGIWHEHYKKPITVKLEFNDLLQFTTIENNPLHSSQKIEYSKNKKKMKVTLQVYESPELNILIYKFGDKVKVLGPKSLVEMVKKTAENVIKIYK